MRRAAVIVAAVLVIAATAASVSAWIVEGSLANRWTAQQETIVSLEKRLSVLEKTSRSQTDWALVAARVEPSVVTVESGDELGSAWVVTSKASGSELITNFHVVVARWSSGLATVEIRLGDATMHGTVVRVDRNNDLAVIHVSSQLAALTTAAIRPRLGSTVIAIGSPLGLDGSVSVGVVSGYRSIDGTDYIQFSAPISPGNSGGPVVNARGEVVAIASESSSAGAWRHSHWRSQCRSRA